jgi:hypothetical protein
MSDQQKPIVWRERDLSTDATIMYYHGRLHIDPVRGCAYLADLADGPALDEVLSADNYEIELRVIKRLPQ